MQTSITLAWPDQERVYHLDIPRLRELQDKRSSGPAEIARRILDQTFRVEDVSETLRLGLIGGGLPASQALVLVNRYLDQTPLLESAAAALTVLGAALRGVETAPEGKPTPTKSPRRSARRPR